MNNDLCVVQSFVSHFTCLSVDPARITSLHWSHQTHQQLSERVLAMISPLPAISLILPLFSGHSKKPSSANKGSDFKHYEGAIPKWETITDRNTPEHICMSPERCPFDSRPDSINKGEGKHTCVSPDRCLYNH